MAVVEVGLITPATPTPPRVATGRRREELTCPIVEIH
jgi:hypothetical protein